jgi:hypothetical protein
VACSGSHGLFLGVQGAHEMAIESPRSLFSKVLLGTCFGSNGVELLDVFFLA